MDIKAFRAEFAERLGMLSAEQAEELEETLMMMPERELAQLCADMRQRQYSREGEEALVGAV